MINDVRNAGCTHVEEGFCRIRDYCEMLNIRLVRRFNVEKKFGRALIGSEIAVMLMELPNRSYFHHNIRGITTACAKCVLDGDVTGRGQYRARRAAVNAAATQINHRRRNLEGIPTAEGKSGLTNGYFCTRGSQNSRRLADAGKAAFLD
jgi:hypothetical protein